MSRVVSRLFAGPFSLRFAAIAAAAATFVSVLALPGSARAQGLFQSPTPNLNTGTTPAGVAAADFNRSGFQGLVVTNSNVSGGGGGHSTMTVYLGTGPNTFNGGNTYTVCAGPTAVVAQDFNSDGYPDIAVACPGSNSGQLWLNDGTGNFTLDITESPTDPVAMVAGDFTGNGLVDLAVIDGHGGTTGITVYLNFGAGPVETEHTALTGTLTGIAAGDFNHDGRLDIAVSDSANNEVHVLTGNNDGTFTSLGSYSTGTGTKPSAIAAADFNHDGNLDVVTTNAGKNTATVLLGSATGALTLQAAQTTGTNPIAISVLDVNSDGYPDVVAYDSPTSSTGEVDVLLGNGNGTLQTAQVSSEAFEPGTVAAVADFNRDGKPDLALTQQNNNLASVLLNNTLPTQYPDGRSSALATALTNGKGNFADGVAVGDFNKDGRLDIAVSYLEDNNVQVLLNNGTGGASGFTAESPYAVGKQPYWIASGDLNGDGYPDLVTANTTDGTISVLLNKGKTGAGTFNAAVPYTVGTQPYQVAIGDLNGDGYPDLAVTNYGANTVSILFGSANGTFTVQPATLPTCANPYGVAIGDFEHNGFPSVAVTCYSAAELEVFPNNGNGTFGTPFITATETNPASLVVGDFNRDGKLDIVAANTTPNDIDFYAGIGNNTFAAGVESPSLNFPDSIAAADFNGDGILDIVGVSPNFNAVELTLGVGDGTFGTFDQRAAGEFPATKQPWAVAVGDFNNDGQLDIVTANTYNQVNIASPAYQSRYLGEYPAVPGGNPSIDVLTNASAAAITVTSSPSPIPANNTDVSVKASVQPAYSGSTPTGSVTFENAAGSPLGTGPYTLVDGVATYSLGHIASGSSYLFTSLYSGDSNFQPTTVSGSGASFTVPGTPVTLSLSPSTVDLGNTFVATVTAVGNATTGSYPHGTATIYIDTGNGTPIAIGTTTLAQVGGGHNSSHTITITATAANNLPVGSYELYAVFNPTSGAYTQGSSADEPLTVIPVPPTPITLSLNPSSVPLGNNFVATVTATGNATTGSYPHGTATIYIDTGATPIALGTTAAFNQIGGGNNSSRTITIAATAANNLPVGSYELYAVFNPTTPPNYGSGASVDEPLTVVVPPPTPTSTSVSCTLFSAITCTATVTANTTGTAVPAGLTVNFSAVFSPVFGGSPTTVPGTGTTNASGQAIITFSNPPAFGSYAVTATFPAQTNYLTSSGSTSGGCIIVCFARTSGPVTFNSFTGAGFNSGFGSLNTDRNSDANRNNDSDLNSNADRNSNSNRNNDANHNSDSNHDNGANQRSMPFSLF